MLDCVIKGGSVVDGTGAPARQADVGIRAGRIVEIGTVNEEAAETIDAGGLVVAPGIVDPHTHYDAQLFWDPAASPSNLHGVTSMIAGNCGFTLAPIAPVDADYLRRMMAKVEGMPLPALETGVPWSWRSFGDYLGALDGNVGLNVGFLVGHCALRRNVMGTDSIGNEATPAQLDAMLALLHESIDAGGLGFSTTLSFTHSDGDGQPVASRWASNDEVLALCRAVSEHEGTTLEYVTDGCLRGFSDAEIDLMAEMTLAGRRALNWNVLTIDSAEPQRYHDQVAACENARARGGTAIALTMPILVEMIMSVNT
jgi:N-acyl-D-aspartate/D-glutamate deacylase